MRIVILGLLLLFSVGVCPSCSDSGVYICTGPKAKSYHRKPDCRGLNKCSGKVKCVTLGEARKIGRKECRICYRR